MSAEEPLKTGYCIFIDTLFQGRVLSVSDETERYIVFETEVEAQKEIADFMMTRLGEFLIGERDFDDAITVEEYVLPVTIQPDGSIADEDGNLYKATVS